MLTSAGRKMGWALDGVRRLAHSSAQPAPLATAIVHHQINTSLPSMVFSENNDDKNLGAEFPNSPFFGGAMDLMVVPKKKVSKHKRGIRNGPRALKPVLVIVHFK
ncbi:hypothetical protein PHJA_001942400 [Phtheirospermum japonicum]|uniref:Uncharacterized protein n=1 Tax=Phtheirospermum japonicum TaxID=374723 RepID=A0A830CQ65_9LAMI|nr:hypothetical protein PHJA_001942400 [Phtheirospermum japonicum]